MTGCYPVPPWPLEAPRMLSRLTENDELMSAGPSQVRSPPAIHQEPLLDTPGRAREPEDGAWARAGGAGRGGLRALPLRQMARGRVAGMCWWPNTLPHLARVSGRTHGRDVWGQTQRHQGSGETPGVLPVPERGRGPGQSALQDAGLPEARGHPGAAQPVGEEDRAAQHGGAGRTGPPWARTQRGVEPAPTLGSGSPGHQQGVRVQEPEGGPGLCTFWLEPGGGTASHQRQGPCRQVSASEKSHRGRVTTAGPRGRRPPGGMGHGGTVTSGPTCAGRL